MTNHNYAESLAKELVGNHRKFESFAWFDKPEDDEEWCIVYTHNRDSGLCDASNAKVIAAGMKEHMSDDCHEFRSSHWACGWVEGYAIRVYANGSLTAAFQAWASFQEKLENYPLLDESDYSDMGYEVALRGIRENGSKYLKEGAPEDWAGKVFSWLWENDQSEVEDNDDQGAWPSSEGILQALKELGLASEESQVE